MMTPYDKLSSLPNAAKYLKPGVTFEILNKIAHKVSDNQAAESVTKGPSKLFKTINGQNLKTG